MRLFKVLCLFAILSLGGCATSGVKYHDMSASIPGLAPNQGRIYFLRNSSFVGAALKPNIVLDDVVVGESQPGGFFYVDARPGPHKVSTSTEVENRVTFVLDPGETKYIKTSVGFGLVVGHIVPELISADQAQKELSDLAYTGGTAVMATTNAPAPALVAAPEPVAATTVIPVPSRTVPPAPAPMAQPLPQPVQPVVPPTAATYQPALQSAPTAPANGSFQIGMSSTTVETLAKSEQNCVAVRGAELLSSSGPTEYYREQCRDGRILMAKCEFRQCQLEGNR